MLLGIVFAFSPIMFNNNRKLYTGYSDDIEFDYENVKLSEVSEKIHIFNNSGLVDFRNADICTGQGTYSDPYVIEDLVIDAGFSGSGILIENSDVYFRIENCTVYNSEDYDAGIKLNNVTKGKLVINNCTSNYIGIRLEYSDNNTITGNTARNNSYVGIYLEGSDNNTISGNTANNNYYQGIYLNNSDDNTLSGNTVNNNYLRGINLNNCNNNTISGNTANYNSRGIYLYNSDDNTISGNTINNNAGVGINLEDSDNNTITGNIMNECGLIISGSLEESGSHDIDTTNLVNGKPLYYYTNEVNLGLNNFTNAGQVILVNCTDSLISNLNTSNGSNGISLYYSYNNTISGNNASYNTCDGIFLGGSNNNDISGNNASYNTYDGIYLSSSDDNDISGNNANNNRYGIFLGGSNNNDISGNTANNNTYGISLSESDYNTISGNTLLGNDECIVEENCQGNEFSDNGSCTYGEGDKEPSIPGYNLFILLGILSCLCIIIRKSNYQSTKCKVNSL